MVLLDTNQAQWDSAPGELGDGVRIGQLITPLTGFRHYGTEYAIDNGAFSGFDEKRFHAILKRQEPTKELCKFVVAPDVPYSAQRTLEVFEAWKRRLNGWKKAFVAQNGVDAIAIPWSEIDCIFIGGDDAMKDGREGESCARAGIALGKWVHWGRVNQAKRTKRILEIMGDYPNCSLDGSGLSQHSEKRIVMGKLIRGESCDEPSLFPATEREKGKVEQ